MSELKPCPFCGESPIAGMEFYESQGSIIRLKATVLCKRCHISQSKVFQATDINIVPFFNYEVAMEGAEKAWNRRAKDEQTD